MEKVKITQEQADMIEEELSTIEKQNIVAHHICGNYVNALPLSLMKIDTDKLIKALYIGYEVEPEFSLGDVLFNMHTNKVFRAQQGDLDSINLSVNKKHLRYATKQESWWFKNDRKVWELKKGDIIRKFVINGAFYEVKHVDGEYIDLFDIGRSRTETEEIDIVSGGYRVVLFAKDRKDIERGD